ncbi:MAG TPA: valine--tRNA ligase [Alphaproteobacteria bacterium]|nr:valine--tRNA ligase [Alphaproteobacteria bacterium]
MLDKTFRPAEVEARHYALWEASGAFDCHPDSNAEPFCIMMPPPNVTGSLHMGHALNHTLQDVLARFERMRGRDVLWQPGTDHAGIATQMVVERSLAAEGGSRTALGRAGFVERVWAWKAESGSTITRQLRRLGASADWRRERFTMDEGLSAAVRKVFVRLHKDGVIYRDKRLVNWDPKLQTAISDLEVEQREIKGHLWHIAYPVEGLEGASIPVATTRPETMLGDTAVAVHPDDERYRALIGRHAILPLVGRRIPIVADPYADPETGSGAVKITPAHDFNDFEVARRHSLPLINIFDPHARLTDAVPQPYRGLDRFEARQRVVADLEAAGALLKVEDQTHSVPFGDRSGVPLEPWLTDQWYADAKRLAAPAIAAVEDGRTRFVPKQWESTYFEWMRNIQPWCISRQLWWGHQIPAWYGPDGAVFVEESEAEASAAAARHYGRTVALTRDPDVLDTWFSSALWPFSTLGWPDRTKELARYYPTDVLVTGFDIIFFWVARMMMMGMHFMGKAPFHTVYIHALVRDEFGQKMSKSKGNIIDPLVLIEKYGADALRLTLVAMAAQGRDIKLAEARVEGYRNFATKLWNAARFCQMNGCTPDHPFDPAEAGLTINRWLVAGVRRLAEDATDALVTFRFNEAAGALYHFVWHSFCDWYLEMAKPVLSGDDKAAAEETRGAAAWALGQILHLLHPVMPFVTEELFGALGYAGGPLITAPWPRLQHLPVDDAAVDEIDWIIRFVSTIRSARSELNVPPSAELDLIVENAGAATQRRAARHGPALSLLARLKTMEVTADKLPTMPKGAVQVVVDEATLVIPLAEIIDLDAERRRLAREIEKLESEIGKIDRKLGNSDFLAKAPAEVVEDQRERRAEAERAQAKLRQAAARLKA